MRKLNLIVCLAVLVSAVFFINNVASVNIWRANGVSSAQISAKRQLPIYSVETTEKKVSLGFNCAWDDTDIPMLIKILDEYGVKATFFVSGSWCKKYPQSVKALYDAGHEIGSHSNTHADLAKLDKAAIVKEITLCNEKIKNITGTRAILFRMPSGSYNDLVINTIKEQGMVPIQWDIDSVDYKNPPPQEMRRKIKSKLRNGSIILLHSGAKNTPAALPGILEDIAAGGFKAVPVSELILPEPYSLDHEGRQHSAAAS